MPHFAALADDETRKGVALTRETRYNREYECGEASRDAEERGRAKD